MKGLNEQVIVVIGREFLKYFSRRWDARLVERTVDGQDGGMTCRASSIRSRTGVNARVPGLYGFNAENAILFGCREDHHVVVFFLNRYAVDRPEDLHRQIALDNGADHGNRLARVGRPVGYLERRDLRSDCKRLQYVSGCECQYRCE